MIQYSLNFSLESKNQQVHCDHFTPIASGYRRHKTLNALHSTVLLSWWYHSQHPSCYSAIVLMIPELTPFMLPCYCLDLHQKTHDIDYTQWRSCKNIYTYTFKHLIFIYNTFNLHLTRFRHKEGAQVMIWHASISWYINIVRLLWFNIKSDKSK